MTSWRSIVANAMLGGVLGGIGLSWVTYLKDSVTDPGWVHDGQYPIVFVYTFPLGMLFGMVTGAGLSLRRIKPRPAGWVGVVGGLALFAYMMKTTLEYGLSRHVLLANMRVFGLPALWAAALVIWGAWLIFHHRSAHMTP